MLMITRALLNKLIILSVYFFAGFLLARSIYYTSFIGVICALIGIVAWTMFLYKLQQLQSESEPAEEA